MAALNDYPVNGKQLQPRSFASGGDTPDNTMDADWVKRSFMISDVHLSNVVDQKNRYWSTANAKFTDSRLGCNIGINCRPQLSPYTDIRAKGRLAGRVEPTVTDTTANYGMGRYYSEAYDDPAQIIYLRFGVPMFSGLLNFLRRAFDINQSSIVRTGRVPSILYDISKLFGSYLSLVTFPVFTRVMLAGKAVETLFSSPTSKFYTLKPTMHLYWSTVNLLVNTIAINAGIYPMSDIPVVGGAINKVVNKNSDDTQKVGKPYKLDNDALDLLSEGMPDIFRGNRHFDIFALANAAQRLANQVYMDDYQKLNNGSATDFYGYLLKENTGDMTHSTPVSDKDGSVSFGMLMNAAVSLKHWFGSDEKVAPMEADPRGGDPDEKMNSPKVDHLNTYKDFFDAEFRMGASFAVFRVDHTGATSESFSSATTESDLSQKLNGVSSTFQQARFALGQGNLIGGAVTEAIGAAVNLATDVVSGAASGATMGIADVIKGLMGDGYIDIPKHWQSSSASLPEQSYSIELVTPYGNVMSWMINIVIPTCMLLAGALPRSTGKQSYTSPFLCQLFDRGRCQIRLGMIESLTIQRGTGDIAFTQDGRPLSVNITFKVKDLSSIMHMPISSGTLLDNTDMTLDEDNILADYLAVFAGQDMYSQIYPAAKSRIRAAKMVMALQKYSSPAWRMAAVHDIATSGVFSPIGYVIEGLARGSETTAGNQ